ncbi:MAG: hypothetical protein IKO78_04740 [Bacilli bacterium]|nr:hypothetical protein [Bacilli bacterium]
MPIDLIIILILLILVVFIYRKFSSFIYSIVIIDLFFRIVDYVISRLPGMSELDNYLPDSIPGVMAKYTESTLYDILEWIYVGIYAIFLGYIIVYFIHKRK